MTREERLLKVVKMLLSELDSANSEEQLGGYFDYLAFDEDLLNDLEELGIEERITPVGDEEDLEEE